MSLQNILKPNNYELVCNSITTDEISGQSSTPITLPYGLKMPMQSTFDNYILLRSTSTTKATVSGPFGPSQTCFWTATRIGDLVTLEFGFPRGNPGNVVTSSLLVIDFSTVLPSIFHPIVLESFIIPISVDFVHKTTIVGTGKIDTNGVMTIGNLGGEVIQWNPNDTNNTTVGLGTNTGAGYSITYAV